MKKLIYLLALFTCLFASAQVPNTPVNFLKIDKLVTPINNLNDTLLSWKSNKFVSGIKVSEIIDKAVEQAAASGGVAATDLIKVFNYDRNAGHKAILDSINALNTYSVAKGESVWFFGLDKSQMLDGIAPTLIKYKLKFNGYDGGSYGVDGYQLAFSDLQYISTGLISLIDAWLIPNTRKINLDDNGFDPNTEEPATFINAAIVEYDLRYLDWLTVVYSGTSQEYYFFYGEDGLYGASHKKIDEDGFLASFQITPPKSSVKNIVLNYTTGISPEVTTSDGENYQIRIPEPPLSPFETISEGGNTGIARRGRNAANFGNIGQNAIDFSVNFFNPSTTIGATGAFSFAFGENTTVSGSRAVGFGDSNNVSGVSAVALGAANTVSGNGATALGVGLNAPSFNETAVGTRNTTYTPVSTTVFNEADRVFSVGNGVSGSPSDALSITKSGIVTFPSLSTTEIGAEATGRVAVTREYLTGLNYLTSNQTITLSGDVTGSGTTAITTAIAAGAVVDADVNASAAIAGTKLANTPAGNIAATTVQAAVNELDSEKVGLAGTETITGAKTFSASTTFNSGAVVASGLSVSNAVSSRFSLNVGGASSAPTWTRNTADAVTTAIVNNANASSTGNILELQRQGTSQFTFDRNGSSTQTGGITATGLTAVSSPSSLNYWATNGTARTFRADVLATPATGVDLTTMALPSATSTLLQFVGYLEAFRGRNNAVSAYSSAATLTLSEKTVFLSGSSFTVTLPPAGAAFAPDFIIKNTGGGTKTIAAAASQNIDGDATITLHNNEAVTLQSNGSDWFIVNKYVP